MVERLSSPRNTYRELRLGQGPQVQLNDLRITSKGNSGARVGVLALIHDIAAVHDLQAPRGVLLDDNHRDTGLVDFLNPDEYFVLQGRAQARTGLVEEQNRWAPS